MTVPFLLGFCAAIILVVGVEVLLISWLHGAPRQIHKANLTSQSEPLGNKGTGSDSTSTVCGSEVKSTLQDAKANASEELRPNAGSLDSGDASHSLKGKPGSEPVLETAEPTPTDFPVSTVGKPALESLDHPDGQSAATSEQKSESLEDDTAAPKPKAKPKEKRFFIPRSRPVSLPMP
jgi:hypothetical protein